MPDINPVAKLAGVAGSTSIRRRPGRSCASAGATRAKARWRTFLAALVRANRAIADAARRQDRYRLRAGAAEGAGRLAAGGRIRARAVRLRQGSRRDLGVRLRQRRRARRRCVLPAGVRRAAGEAGRWSAGAAVDPGEADRLLAAVPSRDRDPRGWINRRAPSSSRRRPACSCATRSSSSAAAEAPARRHRQARARQLRPHRARARRAIRSACSNDDLVFEKATGTRTAALLANVSGTPLCLIEVAGKFGASLAAKGEAAMVDFRAPIGSPICSAPTSRRRSSARHATNWAEEPWALGAFSAAAPSAASRRGAVLMEPMRDRHLFRRRGGARDAVGHGRRRLGIGRARRRRDRSSAMHRHPPRRSRARNDETESSDRLVERQGLRLGAARGAARQATTTWSARSPRSPRPSGASACMACARKCCARSSTAAALPAIIVPIPYPCPNEIYEARMADALAQAKAARRDAHDLRRPVPPGRARLSRAEARRHRHHAAVSLVAAADRRAGARDDRRRAGNLSRRASISSSSPSRLPAGASTRACWPICRLAPIRAARTASSTRVSWPGRCLPADRCDGRRDDRARRICVATSSPEDVAVRSTAGWGQRR